jgi:hypothetical protein
LLTGSTTACATATSVRRISSHRLLVPVTARPGSDESRSRCPGLSLSHRLPTCGCGSLMACVVPGTAGSEWLKKGLLCS